jgi:hypothetical protein
MTKNIIIFRLNVFLRDRPTVLLLLIDHPFIDSTYHFFVYLSLGISFATAYFNRL